MQKILLIICLASLSLGQLNDWMSNPAIQQKTLYQLTLPGSSNAGSYLINGEMIIGVPPFINELDSVSRLLEIPLTHVIQSWAVAQDQDLYQQLNGGIRFVDIRVCWYNGSSFYPKSKDNFVFRQANTIGAWYTHNGVALGTKLQILLDHTKKFLDENPSEVVVLEISHLNDFCPKVNQVQLIKMIEKTLGSYLYPRRDTFDETISQMVDKNQRVIVTLQLDDLQNNPSI